MGPRKRGPMAPQSGQAPAFNTTHALISNESCATCGQEVPPDKLTEIGGRIAARLREQTLAITTQVEEQHATERERADAKAKADLESERQQSAIREACARDEAQKA